MTDEPPRVDGYVVGFRVWSRVGYELRSANFKQNPYVWTVGENRAECRVLDRVEYLRAEDPEGEKYGANAVAKAFTEHPHAKSAAPHHECECGLYAYFWPGHDVHGLVGMGNTVFGAVRAWGHVEVQGEGFRAEYAEPTVLAYRTPAERLELSPICAELGLPLVSLSKLGPAAQRHGRVPTEHATDLQVPSDIYGMPRPPSASYQVAESFITFLHETQTLQPRKLSLDEIRRLLGFP